MAIGAEGSFECLIMRLFVTKQARRLKFQIASGFMTFITFQSGMFSDKEKSGVLMVERGRLQQLFFYYSVPSSLVVGVALKALAVNGGMISLFCSDPLPDFFVAIKAFFVWNPFS